ncbi:putative acyl-CoA thioesterase II [Mycobacterium parascrofulaceum ATCC BAA-614]|uniref:Putative acyl-CoA thioesterase II n=1 Tax=Mycobacterium parascrofulaceum ATCC BAA-614 TaxID=525368 RepID=D5P634_9MYCO|nr:acyl-CoA thioesterase domain-containing protein [Mycobacterium parascrofulaceum]EFG78470.1 putative acyl-CoA thioesterase II [Mycobacterium parascrofulaceum ATCC BAA-614]
MSGADTNGVAGAARWVSGLLTLRREGDVFVGRSSSGPGERLFGGTVAAQALAAAGGTVDSSKAPQSLHAYFVGAGRYGVDVEYHVERTRDGKSFDTRRVRARQAGSPILEMLTSFHRPEPGADWQAAAATALKFEDAVPKSPSAVFDELVEIRTTEDDPSAFALPPFWIRITAPVASDPLARACILTFLSDFGPLPVARPPGTPLRPDAGYTASLDHSVWFHRPFDPQRWHRYEVKSLTNSDSRGLVAGAFYDRSGALIASTSQEALWRL